MSDDLVLTKEYAFEVTVDGRPWQTVGAVPGGATVTVTLTLPRRLAAAAVSVCLHRDVFGTDEAPRETVFPARFVAGTAAEDTFAAVLDIPAAGGATGLFYWHFQMETVGGTVLYSNTGDNVFVTFGTAPGRECRLLVYDGNFTTPAWMRGGVMYHIFLDRFRRGEGPAFPHPGATVDPDWANGIPPYPEKPGQPLANTVFFGGNLWGVVEKLDYLQSLGVTVLYLSPLFTAASNHRYDTGDYETVDSLLGGEEAFDALITAAHARGMRVILDGVFNHTGDDSRYFNRRGTYPDVGAAQSKDSPYFGWYFFRSWPNDYEAWWNIEILPRLNGADPACRTYLSDVAAARIARGADGWRLDVADELPDALLEELREKTRRAFSARGEKDVPLLLGEVWENAADKTAYGARRRYLQGAQLDSVMNYPFREGVLDFLESGDCAGLCATLTEIYASYPRPVCDVLMNLLGTHDTERILSVLGDKAGGDEEYNAPLASRRLNAEQRKKAVILLKMAAAVQYTVYGVPSVFYGDEAGMEGYRDPFCRMPFPWGREDKDLQDYYARLGGIRKQKVFASGEFRLLSRSGPVLAYTRGEEILVAVNAGDTPVTLPVPKGYHPTRELLTDKAVRTRTAVTLPPLSAAIYAVKKDR